MPLGLLNCALPAAPLGQPDPVCPLPAMVAIMPPETSRMRLFPVSTMKRLPDESSAMPWGLFNCALVARLPSPL
jgi:hypothetical protein